MATGVGRVRDVDGLLREAARVRWNLCAPELYEAVIRREEALIAAEGPVVAPTRQHSNPMTRSKPTAGGVSPVWSRGCSSRNPSAWRVVRHFWRGSHASWVETSPTGRRHRSCG
jgi:hypothetical protein